ncbi:MAG TPA: hypothetical protein VJK02_06845 [Anaerolineales bacterium]|nr:hypothetical protein [Anaerolineales bacterium]
MAQIRTEPLRAEIRWLLQAALAVFVVTVAIGILNGLDLVDFDRNRLLTHVHAGTLGWITLGFFAASLWLFSDGESLQGWQAYAPRWLSILAIGSIVIYTGAFYIGNLSARIVGGALTLAAILGLFVWVVVRAQRVRLTVAHLGILAAATTLTVGALVGVLMGLAMSGSLTGLPTGIFVTHPTSLVIGYLILAGMAIAEWRLIPDRRPLGADRWGVAQVVLPFLGGVVISVGAMLDNFMLISLNVPLELAGVIIFLIRLGPRLLATHWLRDGHGRLYAISAVFLAANVGLLTYLIVSVVTGAYGDPPDFARIPSWLIFAMDHAMFIGVMTNALFGLAFEATSERRSLWPWADQLIFWGTNLGMVGFVVGLMRNSATLKQIFTPIMGAAILLAIAAYTLRLQAREPAEPRPVAAGGQGS